MGIPTTESLRQRSAEVYFERGLQEGFCIGFIGGSRRQSSGHNMVSCLEHPAIVQEYIDNELSLGRLWGPFSRNVAPNIHVSPFGLIPKRQQGNGASS